MRDEEKDEIDIQIEKTRLTVHKQAYRFSLFVLVAYGCLAASHWLFSVPSSQIDLGICALCLGIFWVLSIADRYIDTFISEFRIRLKETDKKVSSIQKQLTKLANAFNSSKPLSQEDQTENDEALIARYRAGAERGEAWAQHNLGVTYYNGTRAPKDYVQAAFWYRKAADQGDTASQLFLADLLMGDLGVPADHPEALRLYKLVADAAHTYSTIAEYRIGEMYAEGKGTPKDYKEAIKWWEKAARHGWTLGSYNLGELYEAGAEGVAQNFEEAYFWYYVGCGDEDQKEAMNYQIVARDNMGKRLNPERRREVQKRAQQWLEGKRS